MIHSDLAKKMADYLKGCERKEIKIQELGTSIYCTPLTPAQYDKAHKSESAPERMAKTLIAKAEREDGSPAFCTADLEMLQREAPAEMISRIYLEIRQHGEVEDPAALGE